MRGSRHQHNLSGGGRPEVIPRSARSQALVGRQLGDLEPQRAILILEVRNLVVKRRKPVAFAGGLQTCHQRSEAKNCDADEQDGGHELRGCFARSYSLVHLATLASARSRALRARGLEATSESAGLITLRVTNAKLSPRASARMRSLTARSSSEWYAISAIRPPAESNAGADSRNAARLSTSRFTAILRAWKVRVAGWTPPARRGPSTRSTIARNSAVVSIGRRRRASTIERAIRRAARSSPQRWFE